MATYFVEVNNKFLVRIEHDGSCCGAEHYFLDNYNHVWGAMAYDSKMIKTDCFRGALMHDELVTEDVLCAELGKLAQLGGDKVEAELKIGYIKDEIKGLEDQIKELEDKIREAKARLDDAVGELAEARFNFSVQEERCNAKRPL